MQLVLASRNRHKALEVGQILAALAPDVTVVPLSDDAPDVVEDQKSFFGNAAKKALNAFQHHGGAVLADDSGLVVPSIERDDGESLPGVHSARFAAVFQGLGDVGPNTSDAENNAALQAALSDGRDRSAYFECNLALLIPHHLLPAQELILAASQATGVLLRAVLPVDGGHALLFGTEGRVHGRITAAPSGENGFGYDPYFWLDEHGTTSAALSPEEKNAVSHRGVALRKLAAFLAALPAPAPKGPSNHHPSGGDS